MATFETSGGWFDGGFGWLTEPADGPGASGVLVLPPIGYEWWSSYHTRRVLAERLAAEGHCVLRQQFEGTGNAAGSQWTPGRLASWRRCIVDGARALRERGVTELAIVGIGLGGSLGLELATHVGATRVVVWEPVVRGRREARSLRLRSLEIPAEGGCAAGLSLAGSVLGEDLLTELTDYDLTARTATPDEVLVIGGATTQPLVDHLRQTGAEVRQITPPADADQALSVPTEDAVAALHLVDEVQGWLGMAPATLPQRTGPVAGSPLHPSAHLSWEDAEVVETVVELGPKRLVGIRCAPAEGDPPATVVMLNSGSEPHVGSGRVWVELSRHLAAHGLASVRTDFRGWGESPDEGYAPGRPYDAHGVADTIQIVEALTDAGAGPIVLLGLCAGAWIALRAVLEHPTAGVVALNPQLYWQPGDPVEALLSDTRVRRTAERTVEEEGRRSGRWDVMDRAGKRNPAATWLDRLAAGPTAIRLLFAEGDDGLEYLDNRLARRMAELTATADIEVTEIPEVDHSMHRVWLRPRAFDAIEHAVASAVLRPAIVSY